MSIVSLKSAGQVCVRSSLDQGHSHTRRKMFALILPPLCFSERMNTTAQMASILHHPGVACKHDDGKFQASYLPRLTYALGWSALD